MNAHRLAPIAIAALVVAMAAERAAFADDRASCLDAASQGQTLRDAHKLVEARDKFRICAATVCPPAVQADCTGWVADIEKAVPTVVLDAKDPAGNDVFDVSVSMDGTTVATKIDGAALPVDPGPHTFHFQRPDGTSKEQKVLVPEGQKAMVITASFTATDAAPAAAPAPAPSAPSTTPSDQAGTHASPAHTLGWVAGGLGVAGLVLGGVFTGITLSDKSAGQCNSANLCSNYDSINSAKNAAPVAGAGLIAGGALLITGIALLVFTDSGHSEGTPSASVRAAPIIGTRGGGLSLEGSW